MLSLFNPNPLRWTPLHQITQTQFSFLPRNLVISNGSAAPNLQTLFCSSSSSAVSNLQHESPEITDPIFDFFHSYGFTDAQIKRFINKCPSTELIKPKLEHLLAFGFSPSELIKVICFCPNILATSLKERIEPNLSLLEATFGSKKHIIKAIVNGSWLLTDNLEKHLILNLKILRENSIPMDKITLLFTKFPRVLYKHPNVIIEAITKLKGLGMNPSSSAFIYGMRAVATFKKETWERKMELYRSFGWSEEDTLLAFARQPMCMKISDGKIKKQMEFFTEKLHWDSEMVLRWPVVLLYSLENRVIPRCAVLNVLSKKGLWNAKPNLYSLLTMAEKDFEERFVEKYGKEVPQVIDAYQGKIDFVGFESTVVGSLKP